MKSKGVYNDDPGAGRLGNPKDWDRPFEQPLES